MQQPFIVSTLFEDVQMQAVFPDGKTFVDCVPRSPVESIIEKYMEQKGDANFNLKKFVLENFDLPSPHSDGYHSNVKEPVEENIETLWNVLSRQPDKESGTLIPLPHPYIVPGGRFDEVYYWDSYFTMLGLKESGKDDMVENMVANFSHLINTVGFIPNGNRTYYLGRSQPPFFSMMVQLLASAKGEKALLQYLPSMIKEHDYWMKGKDDLTVQTDRLHHVVRMKDGEILNRYWDEFDTARPESYRQDVELAHASNEPADQLYRHLRAGAESGWDYSSRWFKDGQHFETIHTADIVPVDLNCLLYNLERVIAEACKLNGNVDGADRYALLAEKRKQAIQKYCWHEDERFFTDYNLDDYTQKTELTLAGMSALYCKIADQRQADLAAEIIQQRFLKAGGLITTLKETGQQWDAPNGWAPLQWIAVIALENYGHHSLSKTIALRWLTLNADVFKRTGKLMEKYNVVDTHLEAGGGEYAGQDGFGWTNGVFLALQRKYSG